MRPAQGLCPSTQTRTAPSWLPFSSALARLGNVYGDHPCWLRRLCFPREKMKLDLGGVQGASSRPCWPSLPEGGGSWLLWSGLHNIHKRPLRAVPFEPCFQHGGQQWAGGRWWLALARLLTACVWNVQMFPLGLQLAFKSHLPPTSRLKSGYLGHSPQQRRKPRLLSC